MISSFGISVAILIINKFHKISVGDELIAAAQATYGNDPTLLKEKMAAVTLKIAEIPAYIPAHWALIITVAFTTGCWLVAAYFAPQTNQKTLLSFFKKVRPFGPGWNHIREVAGPAAPGEAVADNIPLALLGWVVGCTTIWSSLFMVGNYLYGRMLEGHILLGVFIVAGSILVAVVNKLWTTPTTSPMAEPQIEEELTR